MRWVKQGELKKDGASRARHFRRQDKLRMERWVLVIRPSKAERVRIQKSRWTGAHRRGDAETKPAKIEPDARARPFNQGLKRGDAAYAHRWGKGGLAASKVKCLERMLASVEKKECTNPEGRTTYRKSRNEGKSYASRRRCRTFGPRVA